MRTNKNCCLILLFRKSFVEQLYWKPANQGLQFVGSSLAREVPLLHLRKPWFLCLNNRPYSIIVQQFDTSKISICLQHRTLPQSRLSHRLFCSCEARDVELPRCWNCGVAAALGPFLACGLCGSVQPVNQSINFFEIFGINKDYDIKDGHLEGRYKDWQKKLHPDLVHSKSEKEKMLAAEQSARVIEAYQTLRKPLLRAMYLVPVTDVIENEQGEEKRNALLFVINVNFIGIRQLKLEGVDVDEERTITDPDLLTEMLEVREAIDEANDSQALKQMQTQLEGNFETWSISFKQAFTSKDFDDAIAAIERMRYYDRALQEIIKKL